MRHPHRTRRAASIRAACALLLALAAAAVLPATAAWAGDPVSLDGRYVVDDAGVLDASGEAEIQDALDRLSVEQGVNLFVVYTDVFENPADRAEWSDEVARLNQLGTDDVLLAVAVDDRLYQLSVDAGSELTADQLDTIDDDYVVPALREDDWVGAAVGAADGIAVQLGGQPVSGSETDAGTGTGDDAHDGRGSAWPVVAWTIAIVVIVLAAAAVVLVVVLRRRGVDRAVTARAAQAGPTQKELDQRVGAVLIDLDDAVTSSEEELGFAVAQFGVEATRPFSAVLDEVKATLSSAFELKQKLDDAVPDTAEERRAWSEQIIGLCNQASDRLDAELEAFTALRDLERDPTPALTAARAALVDADARRADASTRFQALVQRFDAKAVGTVQGNLGQSESLSRFAGERLTAADTALAAGDTAQAALRIREAQQASTQAVTLLDSVGTLERDLAQAAEGLAAAVAEARADLDEAATVTAGSPGAPADLPRLTAALATELEHAARIGERDPLTARLAVEKANVPLDAALATVRGERDRQARLVAQRDRAIASAQAEIASAQSYLQTRRGVVGADARTRLSEAQRHLDQALALATTDPEGSLREATSASQLATLAASSAQQDVSWAGSGGAAWPSGGSGSGGSGGGDFAGALLGGIVGGLLGGGGGGRSSGWSGGWGGGSRGGGRSSGFSGGGRSSRGGSFGGGRSSGGGRRGGGGRF
ncbi:TPM domain-containing protein [Herbiconiux moechotypicola]|nr:TPM domain-containing protein [Herbiconiux moechotypicola]MCS5728414.1 TPM domain-containing protein [Herbiconiux moechotypicola]